MCVHCKSYSLHFILLEKKINNSDYTQKWSVYDIGYIIYKTVGSVRLKTEQFPTPTGVSALHSDIQPLDQELEWPRLSCHRRVPVSEVAGRSLPPTRPAHHVTRPSLTGSCIEPTVSDISSLSDFQPRWPHQERTPAWGIAVRVRVVIIKSGPQPGA